MLIDVDCEFGWLSGNNGKPLFHISGSVETKTLCCLCYYFWGLQDASYSRDALVRFCFFDIFCALPHFLCLDIVEVTLTTGWLAPVVVTRMTTTFTEVSAACTLNLVVTQRDLAGLSHVVFVELFPYRSYLNRFSLSHCLHQCWHSLAWVETAHEISLVILLLSLLSLGHSFGTTNTKDT